MGFENKTNVTPENLTSALEQSGSNESLMIGLNQTAQDIGDAVGSQALGSSELAGMFTLLFFGVVLWRSDAGTDVAAAVFVPTTLFLANFGLLPFASGLIDGLLIVVAGMFAWGLARLAFR